MYKQAGTAASANDTPYLAITLTFTLFVYVLENYLDTRQLGNFKAAKDVPVLLKEFILVDKFAKSLRYGIDKFSFGIFENSFMLMVNVALLLLGYMPYVWDMGTATAVKYGLVAVGTSALRREIIFTIIFLFLTTIHDTVIGLPFSLYRNFVVEEKHGFNKTTLGLFFRDKLISLLLTFVIGGPIIAAIISIIRWGGEYFFFYVWAFLLAVSVLMMTIYPTVIAPLFNKYTLLDTSGDLYKEIEKLAVKVKFPLTKIYTVDGSKRSSHSNAYFYGWFNNKRIVLYDTLMTQVTTPELLAILGHEMGHWKLWHTMQGFVIMQTYLFLMFVFFSFVQNTPALFTAFGFGSGGEQMPVFIGLMLFSQVFMSPVDKLLNLAINANSRYNEFMADKFAGDMGMGRELQSGLIKISIENLGNLVPDPLYSTYHFSHPPLVERLAAISKAMERDKKKK